MLRSLAYGARWAVCMVMVTLMLSQSLSAQTIRLNNAVDVPLYGTYRSAGAWHGMSTGSTEVRYFVHRGTLYYQKGNDAPDSWDRPTMLPVNIAFYAGAGLSLYGTVAGLTELIVGISNATSKTGSQTSGLPGGQNAGYIILAGLILLGISPIIHAIQAGRMSKYEIAYGNALRASQRAREEKRPLPQEMGYSAQPLKDVQYTLAEFSFRF